MTTIVHRPARPRELIRPVLFRRLSRTVQEREDIDSVTADRVVEQALSFLSACALNPNARLAPSRLVDAGWHAFLLHTADYAEFCQRIAGRFIHHLPTPSSGDGGAAIRTTMATMDSAGLPVDEALWPAAADCDNSKCHQCHAGCYDSPKRA